MEIDPESLAVSRQSSQWLEGEFLEFGGIRHELSRLCGGTLIAGNTGCGKTLGVLNPLAARLARHHADDLEQKACVIYFNCKGSGDASFLEALPESRRQDVMRVTREKGVCLFPGWAWPDREELALAVAAFLPELGRLLHATDFEYGGHFLYWQNLRDRLLREVALLEALPGASEEFDQAAPLQTSLQAEALTGESQFLTTLERVAALVEEVGLRRERRGQREQSGSTSQLMANKFGVRQWNECLHLQCRDWAQALHADVSEDELKLRAKWLAFFQRVPASKEEVVTFSAWEEFVELLMAEPMQERAREMAKRYEQMGDSTWDALAAEVSGLGDPFLSPSARAIFGGQISFEEIIDEGRIAIIDLPQAGAAGANRAVLLALLFALTNTILGRYRRVNRAGNPINRKRPIILVLDEFHTLLTRGRDEGFELFLSRCREFGCIALLATQNLQLVASALGRQEKFQALLNLFSTSFFGRNTDALTNLHAAHCCGVQASGEVRALAMDFGLGSRKFSQWIKEGKSVLSDEPRVSPARFPGLRAGQFVVCAADGTLAEYDAFAPTS